MKCLVIGNAWVGGHLVARMMIAELNTQSLGVDGELAMFAQQNGYDPNAGIAAIPLVAGVNLTVGRKLFGG